MSVAEIKRAIDELTPAQVAEVSAFLAERDASAWDRQIDEDFAEGGRLHGVLEEVRTDIRAGRLDDLPS
jgi:hypothetical protein